MLGQRDGSFRDSIQTTAELILLVEDKLVVELKSVEKTLPVHEVRMLTYMKLANIEVGLLINFNVERLKGGLTRFVL